MIFAHRTILQRHHLVPACPGKANAFYCAFFCPLPTLLLTLLVLLLTSLGAPKVAQAALILAGDQEAIALLKSYLPPNARRSKYREMAKEILATEGYFAPSFDFVQEKEDLRLTITLGPRTTVEAVEITIDGPNGLPLPAAKTTELLRDWPLKVGAPMRQSPWNDGKQILLNRLLSDEFATARIVDSLVDVNPADHTARAYLYIQSGPSYRIGELEISGLHRYSPELVQRYNRILQPGDIYSASKFSALQVALQNTPYFSSARLILDKSRAQAVKGETATLQAPVRVLVREKPAHRLSFGVGYSSNTGARLEARYLTPNFLSSAWSLESALRLEEKSQALVADLFFPPTASDKRNGLGSIIEKSDIEGLKIERFALGVQSIFQRGDFERRITLFWQKERYQPHHQPYRSSQALTPNVQWTWRKIDDPMNPSRGYIWQFEVGGGVKAVLSDQDFLRLHLRGQHFFSINPRNQFTLRYELGHTFAKSLDGIPQDFLFRTGGTGTVRGYRYQSLGVEEGSATLGGRSLAIVSGEWTHWLNPQWGVAAFVDIGNAWDNKPAQKNTPLAQSDKSLAVGYGLGVRWKSPAGPLGLDVAYGAREQSMQMHFALGLAF